MKKKSCDIFLNITYFLCEIEWF